MKRIMMLLVFALLFFVPGPSAYTSTKTLGELNIGDKVVDNSWQWEHRTGNNYTGTGEIKPVTWIVVAKDHYGPGSGVTLLAEELIGKFTFDNTYLYGNELQSFQFVSVRFCSGISVRFLTESPFDCSGIRISYMKVEFTPAY